MEQLRRGDVITVPRGRFAGIAVILDPGLAEDGPKPTVVTADRQFRRLTEADFTGPVEPLGRVRVANNFNPRSPQARRDLANTLHHKGFRADSARPRKAPAADDPEIARLRRALREHPCHACPDREEHARRALRTQQIAKDTEKLRAQVDSRTGTIARTFDRVCAVLDARGYLDGDRLTAEGRRLSRLWTEMDLLAAECLRRRIWHGLAPAELAACVSILVYESRRSEDAGPPRLPEGRVREALAGMTRLWAELDRVEKDHRVSFLREPDLGFVSAAYRWANGRALDAVLREADLSAGDFVRWCKQLIDLLGQIAAAGDEEIRGVAEAALNSVRRGVVAYSSVNSAASAP
jgi:ATP-dependent RNA helicase HelY